MSLDSPIPAAEPAKPTSSREKVFAAIASGIEASRAARQSADEGSQPPAEPVLSSLEDARVAEPEEDGLRWPRGFTMTPAGLIWNSFDGKEKTWLCGPFHVLGLGREENQEAWNIVIQFHDPDGASHDAILPMADLAGDAAEIRRQLAAGGLSLNPTRTARERLVAALAGLSTPRRTLIVRRCGWHRAESLFALPNVTIGGAATEQVLFPDHRVARFAVAGSFEGWKKEVASLAAGQDRLIFSLGLALTGPLIGLLNLESGGAHFFGPSSCGKTTALQLAGSVWGGDAGAAGFAQSWRATGNALEAVAGAHNQSLLALDEIAACPASELESIAYLLSSGTGKARLSSAGVMKNRSKWQLALLSSGEMSFAARAAEARTGGRNRAGQGVRLIDLPADAGRGFGIFDHIEGFASAADLAKAIKSATGDHYGWAGPEFVRQIIGARDEGVRAVRQAMNRWLHTYVPKDCDGQVSRVGERFALAAAAGELAAAYGILPFAADQVADACGRLFALWIARRGGTGSTEAADVIGNVRRFIQAHHQARFVLADQHAESWRAQNLAGAKTAAGDDQQFYFNDSGWREAIGGMDSRAAADALSMAGFLVRDKDGRRKVVKRIGGHLQRVFAVRASILEGDADA